MNYFILCLALFGLNKVTYSQDVDTEALLTLESELLFYADVMVNTFESSSRQRAAAEFEVLFQEYLDGGQAFSREAEFHKYISILDSPDNNFKLISWIKRISDEVSDYSGYLYFENGKHTMLNRAGIINDDFIYSVSNQDEWYGCLYYKIMKSGDDYLVFGFDSNGKYDNNKIVDILSLQDEEVQFGKAVFEDKEELGTYVNRLLLTFASDASVNLNYNAGLKMIVHDHLEQRMGLQPGQGPTNIPDGTYEGYQFEKNKWNYKKKIFNHVYENAPRPKPVFSELEDEKKPKN